MQIRPFRLILLPLGLMVLTACGGTAQFQLTDQLRTCQDLRVERPAEETLTVGELSAFSDRQEAALQKCNKRIEELAHIVERRRH